MIRDIIFFFFSLIPGASQMYMGLFKRGVQLMVTTIGSFTLLLSFNAEQLIPVICVPLWFFSFFDGYNIRKQIAAGKTVKDEEVYSYDIFLSNKKFVGFALLFLGIIGLINSFPSSVIISLFGVDFQNVYWSLRRSIVPLFLIISGAYLLLKSRKIDGKE
ncbi:hypothetical protein [Lutispora thermophila]|uniref:Uncharacterized protein n=1 Tax=Lutispora thermophila DSM 19022 TaxID=1122184 RepID=A0A1M6EIB5_9FIRM|nr:hypothetical protein [Lutispora thermophila]SHI85206.1 hypothetical protein SAMN02745176_01581 [Lutispora thermophila DSM 19022]